MFDVFESLKSIVKLDTICIDNNVFRLHYKFSVLLLVAFSILVSCRQYFGDPIDCIQNDDIPENVLETFCWIHSTFSLPKAWDKEVGVDVPHPGIDKHTPKDEKKYHSYYQWVCFVLFLQAIFFYTPRYLWKKWEGGKIKDLILGMNCPIMNRDERDSNRCLLVEYLKNYRYTHKTYAACFVLSEVLNFVNVIGQIYLIDTFLGGEFTRFGVEVLRFSEMEQEHRVDPMIRVFPRMTKCTFHRYGSSGDVQKHDALCILPLNIINEKIFIILWFWFIILAVLSTVVLVGRCILFIWPGTRYWLIRSRNTAADNKRLRSILSRSDFGDWFLLYLLCKNMDPLHFRDLVNDYSQEIKEGERLLEKRKPQMDDYSTI